MKVLLRVVYWQILLFAIPAYCLESAVCGDAKPGSSEYALCSSYCEILDCSGENAGSPQCNNIKSQYLSTTGDVPPCEKETCSLIEPGVLLERISLIPNPDYICYADTDVSPYTYVEYIVESGGVPQIGLGMEDQFNDDGTWYGYYFEYQQSGDPGELPEFFRYDLTAEEVSACRKAFEPPFSCPQ